MILEMPGKQLHTTNRTSKTPGFAANERSRTSFMGLRSRLGRTKFPNVLISVVKTAGYSAYPLSREAGQRWLELPHAQTVCRRLHAHWLRSWLMAHSGAFLALRMGLSWRRSLSPCRERGLELESDLGRASLKV